MDRLINIGFIQVGYWTLKNSLPICTLNSNHRTRNILYTFISNGEIKYIGKTVQVLGSRMYGYQNPGKSQSTNIRVNRLISESLNQNKPVDIFVLADNGLLSFGGFRVNMAAGLEDTLIYEICPEWNYSGKKRIIEEDESQNTKFAKQQTNHKQPKSEISFIIKLGRTYFNRGFINIPVAYADLFAGDSSIIEIALENEQGVIHGYINRRANKNVSPRIMGGASLRDWFHRTFSQDEDLKVSIVSPISIILTK